MKIDVEVLGWEEQCCGCGKIIKSTDKVFMLSEILGLSGSIHLCSSCIEDISYFKEQEVLNDY